MPYEVLATPVKSNLATNHFQVNIGIDLNFLSPHKQEKLKHALINAATAVGGGCEIIKFDNNQDSNPYFIDGELSPNLGCEVKFYLPGSSADFHNTRATLVKLWEELESLKIPLICKPDPTTNIKYKGTFTPFSTEKNHGLIFSHLSEAKNITLDNPLVNTKRLYNNLANEKVNKLGQEIFSLNRQEQTSYKKCFDEAKVELRNFIKYYLDDINGKSEGAKKAIREQALADLSKHQHIQAMLSGYPLIVRDSNHPLDEAPFIKKIRALDFSNINDVDIGINKLQEVLNAQLEVGKDGITLLESKFNILPYKHLFYGDKININECVAKNPAFMQRVFKAIAWDHKKFVDYQTQLEKQRGDLRDDALEAQWEEEKKQSEKIQARKNDEPIYSPSSQYTSLGVSAAPSVEAPIEVMQRNPRNVPSVIAPKNLMSKLKSKFHDIYFDPMDPNEKDRLKDETGGLYLVKTLLGLPDKTTFGSIATWLGMNIVLLGVPLIKRILMLGAEVLPAMLEVGAEHVAEQMPNTFVGAVGYAFFKSIQFGALGIRSLLMRFTSPERSVHQAIDAGAKLGDAIMGSKNTTLGKILGYTLGGVSALVTAAAYFTVGFILAPVAVPVLGTHIAGAVGTASNWVASVTGPITTWLGGHVAGLLAGIGIKAAASPAMAAVISIATAFTASLATLFTTVNRYETKKTIESKQIITKKADVIDQDKAYENLLAPPSSPRKIAMPSPRPETPKKGRGCLGFFGFFAPATSEGNRRQPNSQERPDAEVYRNRPTDI